MSVLVFSIFALGLLVSSAGLVQLGIIRTVAHWTIAWGAVLPMGAYFVLSLRELARKS